VLGALQEFAKKDPAAGFDLARAAAQARRMELASGALKEFAERCGHRQIGNTHTAVLLSQLLAAHGQAGEALDNLDAELKKAPNLSLRASRAGLLEAMGRPKEAGKEAEALIAAAPKEQSLYRLLARTREQQGERPAAAAALEAGLACTCGSPGKCGNQAFDVEAGRMLARLYLEDRAEPARAQELLKELSQNVQEPTWEDHYLTSLLARNDGDPKAPQMALQLSQALKAGDPRKVWLEKSFPGMIG
jgi:predicted Zn-dependent protease